MKCKLRQIVLFFFFYTYVPHIITNDTRQFQPLYTYNHLHFLLQTKTEKLLTKAPFLSVIFFKNCPVSLQQEDAIINFE